MKSYALKDDLEMFKRFAQSIIGFGYNIANAKLFVLGVMIEKRTSVQPFWSGSYVYDPRLGQIVNLIEYAKEATANEKTIYLHTIVDWLTECINEIDKKEAEEARQREWNRQRVMEEANQIANQSAASDAMGDIPF